MSARQWIGLIACLAILVCGGCTANQAQEIPAVTPSAEPAITPEGPDIEVILQSLEGLSFDAFLEESNRLIQLRDTDNLYFNELAGIYQVDNNAHFSDLSLAYLEDTQRLEARALSLLQTYDRDSLSSQQQLNYDIYQWYLEDLVQEQAFNDYHYLVNPFGMWGLQNWLLTFMTESQPITTSQQAEEYISRLSETGVWTDWLIDRLGSAQEAGIIPPSIVVEFSIGQVESALNLNAGGVPEIETHPLYQTFSSQLAEVDAIDPDTRESLLAQAQAEIEDTFTPAFTRLQHALESLLPLAPLAPGVGQYPDGDEYYRYLLRHWTTTDMTVEEIHQRGLQEVARIQQEMVDAAVELGYPEEITLAEINQIIEENTALLTGDALLEEYQRQMDAAAVLLDRYFNLLPAAALSIRVDPNAPPAYYSLPSPDGTRPGEMVVSLVNPAAYTLYNVPVLVHHETLPGHHIQHALARELDLPDFQMHTTFNPARFQVTFQAYTEGWALYAEGLAAEMGLYQNDPYGNLGRLRLLLDRVTRMVVDTGIHAMGWSWEQAIGYMEEATGRPQSQNSLLRYVSLPAQNVGYDVGYLTILDLRQQAMDALGDRFDIRAFHDVILGSGPMPLEILQQVVEQWIAAQSTE